MEPNPYRAEPLPDHPDLPKRPLAYFAALLVGILFLSGGIGLVAGTALSNSDWRLGLAAASILAGLAISKLAAAPLSRR